LQLQGKPANDVEGTSKVSIESQPNLYHSTPFLVKNEQSTQSISKSSPSQIGILIFLAKTEKTFSNSFPSQVAIYAKFGKKEPPPAYICALVSAAHPSVSEEVEGHKNNFVSV